MGKFAKLKRLYIMESGKGLSPPRCMTVTIGGLKITVLPLK
jgi:hypothetical protein